MKLSPIVSAATAAALSAALSAAGPTALGAQPQPAALPTYAVDPQWLKLPEGRAEIGSMHGDIAVSAAGEASSDEFTGLLRSEVVRSVRL